jgi:predicted lysophospholipase L1 biosynthesis ABC-type transport system permease subunit
MVELPVAVQSTQVVLKHLSSGFYPAFIYVVSAAITMIPLMLLELTIFSNILYWYVVFTLMLLDCLITLSCSSTSLSRTIFLHFSLSLDIGWRPTTHQQHAISRISPSALRRA